MKNIRFLSEKFSVFAGDFFYIYLNKRVFVMQIVSFLRPPIACNVYKDEY